MGEDEIRSGITITHNSIYNSNTEGLERANKKIKEQEELILALRLRIDELKEELANSEDAGFMKDLEERVKAAEKALTAALSSISSQFEAFKQAFNLDKIEDKDLAEWTQQLSTGAITLSEAMSLTKDRFKELIQAGGAASGGGGGPGDWLQVLLTKIDEVLTSLGGLESKLENIKTGAGGSALADAAATAGTLAKAVGEVGDEAAGSTKDLTGFVAEIVKLSQTGDRSLFNLSSIFKGLGEISHGGIGEKTVTNVANLAKAMQDMGDVSAIRVDFSGFKDLKISKASMRNLADYLPTIAGANVDNLVKLSNVDLTNFNNLKVNKGAAEELAKIAEAIQIFKEAKAGAVSFGTDGVQISAPSTQSADTVTDIKDKTLELINVTREGNKTTLEYANANRTLIKTITQVRDEEGNLVSERERIKESPGKQRADEEKQSLQEQLAWEKGVAVERKRLSKEVADGQKEAAQIEKEAAEASRAIRQKEAEEEGRLQSIRKDSASSVERIRDALVKYASVSGKASNKEAYANLVKYNEAYSKLDALYANGKISLEGYRRGVDNLDKKVKENTDSLNQNANSHSALGAKLKSVIAQYLSFTRIVSYAVRSVREMVQASMELDKALTQMQIVTGATDAEMKRFSDTAFEAANRAASNVTDIISGATTYARLGFDPQTSTALAEYTAMLQNVGDINAQDAQDAITAIIKAFDGVDETNIKEKLDELVVVGRDNCPGAW